MYIAYTDVEGESQTSEAAVLQTDGPAAVAFSPNVSGNALAKARQCRSQDRAVPAYIPVPFERRFATHRLGFEDTTTARSLRPREILGGHAAEVRPRCSGKTAGSVAVSSATVVIPMLARGTFARRPIPLTFFAASGQMRDSRSALRGS